MFGSSRWRERKLFAKTAESIISSAALVPSHLVTEERCQPKRNPQVYIALLMFEYLTVKNARAGHVTVSPCTLAPHKAKKEGVW